MPRQDGAQLVFESVSAWCRGMLVAARIGEDDFHAMIDQRLHENIGAADHLSASRGFDGSCHDRSDLRRIRQNASEGDKPRRSVVRGLLRQAIAACNGRRP